MSTGVGQNLAKILSYNNYNNNIASEDYKTFGDTYGGTLDKYKTDYLNDPTKNMVEPSGLENLFGTDSGRAMVNAGLGVGQLGLGLASYLSNAKMLKKQGALMDQQLANNTKEMARRDDALASMNGSGAAVRERYDRAKANPTNSIG